MQKFLLSAAVVALGFNFASAEVLNFSDVDWDSVEGTYVPHKDKEDGSGVANYANYQPVEAFELGGYTFEFGANADTKTQPAFYTSKNNEYTVRLYLGNIMTVSAPEGVKFGKMTFTTTNEKSLEVSASEGTFTKGTNTLEWVNETPVETMTFTVTAGSVRFTKVEFTAEGGTVTPPVAANVVWESLLDTATECDWTLDVDMTQAGEDLEYVWSWKSYNDKEGNPVYYYLNASAYKGSAFEASAWAISPVVDLTAVNNATVTWESAARFQTTLQELCSFNVREEGATEWTKVEIPVWPTAGGWTWSSCGDINLDAFAGKKVQFGFKYGSSATGADTWEIRNFKVTTEEGDAVSVVEAENVAPVYFDIQGRKVVNPANGLYIKVVGNKATKVFVK